MTSSGIQRATLRLVASTILATAYPKIKLNHVHKITLPPNDMHEPSYIKNVLIKTFSLTLVALSNLCNNISNIFDTEVMDPGT